MNPFRLIQFRGIFAGIFGIEMIMSCGDLSRVIDDWFLIGLLSGERISGWFLFIDISIMILFDMADFSEMFFKLLGGSESWK